MGKKGKCGARTNPELNKHPNGGGSKYFWIYLSRNPWVIVGGVG